MFGSEPKRFKVTHLETISMKSFSVQIIVDRQTGVNYLVVHQSGQAPSVTPLLDSNGHVICDQPEDWQNDR